jgi:polyhydroxyalkanoate synthesis regulator phasin
MSFHRALDAFALAALVLAGCNKSADKGKTEDQLVADGGFTKEQAKCITDDVWDKIPKKDLDKLTDANAKLTEEQQTVFSLAAVKCARDKIVEQMKTGLTTSDASVTPAQIDCIVAKLTDDDLVNIMKQQTDALTTAVTACVTS